jgi:Tol biopolymer transport system component
VSSSRTGTLDVFAFNRDAPGAMVQVTSDSGQVTSASLSPDGTRIVYVTNSGGTNDIFVADADGGNPVIVAGSEFVEDTPDWSFDGSRIAYQSNEGGPPQVWVMNADGSGKRQLTSEGANTQPAFSEDDVLAFTSTRDGNYEVYLMDADGSNQRNITNSPARELNPVWMAGGQVAFVVAEQSVAAGLTMQVFRRDAMGGRTSMSPPGMTVTDFAVSPSGDLLALVVSTLTDQGQTNKLYLQRIDVVSGPVEIRTNNPNERFFGVSFRR